MGWLSGIRLVYRLGDYAEDEKVNQLEINGEYITVKEAADLVKMLCHDAEQVAGVFHGMNRSEKFRINWPDEDLFVKANWKTFVEAVRQMYAERLGDPKTPPAEARKMHLAIVLQDKIAKGQETDTRLQLAPNTQQFEGEKTENQKIMERFGPNPNFRAAALNSVAALTRH